VLERIDSEKWKTLSRNEASALISSVPEEQRRVIFENASAERAQGRAPADPNGPATPQQRAMLRKLVASGDIDHIKMYDWRAMTSGQADAYLAKIPEDRISATREAIEKERQAKAPVADKGMER